MRMMCGAFVIPVLLCAACSSNRATPVSLAKVKNDVKSFTLSVADDVTRQGPSAWQNYFESSPSFFMAVDGGIEFPDGASARAAIPTLSRTMKKLELHWGEPLRIDPLTQELAMIGTPWHEIIMLADEKRLDNSGYFTALAEKLNGQWRLRNAHWSTLQNRVPAK